MKINKSKKAQVKIQETAFVLLALMILFSLAFIFYFRLQASSLAEKGEELRQKQAISLLDKITAMPELRCSTSLGRATESLCVDKDKVRIFTSSDSAFKENYEDIWKGLKNIRIMQIYPQEEEFNLYYKSEGNETYSTFISLCHEEYNGIGWHKCSIGMILVSI
jgi:hypothetical protein